jgi:hypothetical protein
MTVKLELRISVQRWPIIGFLMHVLSVPWFSSKWSIQGVRVISCKFQASKPEVFAHCSKLNIGFRNQTKKLAAQLRMIADVAEGWWSTLRIGGKTLLQTFLLGFESGGFYKLENWFIKGFLLVVSHHVYTCKELTCLDYPQFSWIVAKLRVHRSTCLTQDSFFSFLFFGLCFISRLGIFNVDNIIPWLKIQSSESGQTTWSTTKALWRACRADDFKHWDVFFWMKWLFIVQVEGLLYILCWA